MDHLDQVLVDQAMHTSDRKLEVILKISEVCNIACDYCYYYFSGDDRPLSRPHYFSKDKISKLISFLNDGYASGLYSSLQIDFHGGEPLMIGPTAFEAHCQALRSQISAPMRLCITTNAMLIDERWIDLFERQDVAVCISIDGSREQHDRHRIDKRGKGTYDRVISGLDQLKLAAERGRIKPPSALCVVQPDALGGETYHHIVHELGLRNIDFLLPDVTHDYEAKPTREVQDYMSAVMAAWLSDDSPDIRVRILSSILSLLVGGRSYLAGFGDTLPYAITVGSDGTIDSDDFLKPCGVDLIQTRHTIDASSLADVVQDPVFVDVSERIIAIPDECRPCEWVNVCRGGQATHRFSKAKGFNNPSVYCSTQKSLFKSGATHLLSTGVSDGELLRHLV